MDMARMNWQNFQPLNEAHVAEEQLQEDAGNADWETQPKEGN